MSRPVLQANLEEFFRERGWSPFPFQLETWEAYLTGASGLVHAPTGMGKTLAVWLGPVLEWMAEHPDEEAWPDPADSRQAPALTVLWLTPLRALASDTAEALRMPLRDLGVPWTVGLRTGDTSSTVRSRQRDRPPTALVTTPESLSLLLSYPETAAQLRSLRAVIVDEWHEMLGSKRGVQAELCLARLRGLVPGLRTWGLSATLGNLEEAKAVLLGMEGAAKGRMVSADERKEIVVETILPESMERFPWSGHIGLTLLPEVLEAIAGARSTLLFCNTRNAAEQWFASIVQARPEWEADVVLHHGSLDRALREANEEGLKTGRVRCAVATSSLDLGVDFSPVDQVIQVGSAKGIARLIQRAGRAGHAPGQPSRVVCVPTNAFELVEYAAARDAVAARRIESRVPYRRPLDVLVQHMVTLACGSGFHDESLYHEVRDTFAFQDLSAEEWGWCLEFITIGGRALNAYPQFRKVSSNHEGIYTVRSADLARQHRLSIGTITDSQQVTVKFAGGAALGTVEENYLTRLKIGDRFLFSGRVLELVRFDATAAIVRLAKEPPNSVPRWQGGKMPLSTQLAEEVRRKLEEARRGIYRDPEMERVRPVLELQGRWSVIPAPGELLIEMVQSREGHHAYVYPLAGRLVHEGLGPLVAWRIAQMEPRTLTATANDYGFELVGEKPLELTEEEWRGVLSPERLLEDLLACLNATELARRQFRDIARVAGLIVQGYPGQRRAQRHLQVSSGLLFDVFAQFDPENLLLDQARREVLEGQLDIQRLRATLEAMEGMRFVLVRPLRLTPLAFPLWAGRMREAAVSSERWTDRIARMVMELEDAADGNE